MISDDERDALIAYIQRRKCVDAQRGDPCIDRQGKHDLIGDRHPACYEAEQMIEVSSRAE